ncbi:MAG TPA: SpoIIE family protein phosphatase [Spirochaetota bacterium]|nr:SpoIIE family protein phosphatase [Spirochaetota bacterium]HPN82829.1 SpoIIE family protein phosphatase [Spirochaetota bacterium]
MNCCIDVDSAQEYKQGQLVCGDTFLSHRVKEENRTILVLSDGLGSGIKASVLATLTATMATRFISNCKDIRRTAEIIMRTLPVCKVRKINYATFTIVDISSDLETQIIEYDNPPVLIARGNDFLAPERQTISVGDSTASTKNVRYTTFRALPGDRIVMLSDGVTQSGMGTRSWPLGWGIEHVEEHVRGEIRQDGEISARELARSIVKRALGNDVWRAKDDTTCGVVHFREPRELMVLTGPPIDRTRDRDMADMVREFTGRLAISGGTTANIIARELGRDVRVNLRDLDPSLPPKSEMEGIDLVTEGILTLGKVAEMLENGDSPEESARNAATELLGLLLSSDRIRFVVGTRINEAHQDPNIPVELEIRRNVVKKISHLLEEKHLKESTVSYI